MKKTATIIFAAIIGGVSSTGIYKLLEEKQPSQKETQIETLSQKNLQSSVQLTGGLTGIPEKTLDFTAAAEMTVNGVVHVMTEMQAPQSNFYYSDPFRDFFFGQPNQPQQPILSAGSGVIVSADGYIVTNNHVVKDAEKISITLNNKIYSADIISADPSTDIALLKIDAQNLPYIPYGNSDNLKIGEWVLAVGNPFNLTSTVTAGIVSAKGRNINILEGDRANGIAPIESFIQTDAAVNPGNSGGALVNTRGELVGINTAIKSNTGSYTGYSFAIPVNIVKKVVNDLLEFGVVQRAFIGVSIRDIDSELAEKEGIKDMKGVYVAGVTEDGAAKEAGINEGDIITQIETMPVTDVPELQEQVSKYRPGDKIKVAVISKGEKKDFWVTLKNRFGTTESVKKEKTQTLAMLGASFLEVSPAEKSKLKIENGLKIVKLQAGKLRSAGLKEGFIITKADKKDIRSYDDLENALKNKRGGVLIEGVYSNGMRAYYGFGL